VIFAVALWTMLFAGAGTSPAANTQQVWLVVGASDPSPAVIARKARALSQGRTGSVVFATRDCGEKRNVFGWAAEIAGSPEAAQAALSRVRPAIKDAYLKRCAVRAGSLLALGLPAVDPSVADVPEDAVNWTDEDRISSTTLLTDGRVLVLMRYFVNDPNDEIEGKREKVLLVTPDGKTLTLIDPCLSASPASVRAQMLAFTCARESAGEHELVSTFVFGADGKQILEVPHCTKPKWVGDQALSCSDQSVNADGELKLRPKRVKLP
jgi:hypothetical protein